MGFGVSGLNRKTVIVLSNFGVNRKRLVSLTSHPSLYELVKVYVLYPLSSQEPIKIKSVYWRSVFGGYIPILGFRGIWS